MNPKISVIVPVYNVESYVEETMNCLINQTFIDNIEVLLIDDGSTDNSRYIVEKYAFEYENFHAYHTPNRGLCSTRNFGLTIARGEYVCFLDADDLITYDTYEKLYDFAKTGDYDVVTTKFLRFDDVKTTPHLICDKVFSDPNEDITNSNMIKNVGLAWDMVPWNKIIKKALLDENHIRFSYQNIIHEDNLFSIELYSKAKKVGGLNEFHYFWRIRNDNTSISQYDGINKGEKLREMFRLVNNFITNNISEETVLNKKYEKILTLDFFYFIQSIRDFSENYQQDYFQYLYDMVELIPETFLENLNSYFKVMYEIIKNEDLENLLAFTSINVYNPVIPENLNRNYADKLELRKDSHYENLEPFAYNAFINNDCLVLEFNNDLKFNRQNDFDKVYFKVKNNSRTQYESKADGNKFNLPFDLIECGENNLFITCFLDNVKKESYMRTELNKTFALENYYLTVKRNETGTLQLIKTKKKTGELNITGIKLGKEKLHFAGKSNINFEKIRIEDIFGFEKIEYCVDCIENELNFDISFADLLKVPIKKWKLKSEYEIKLTKEYEFITEQYIISIKNQYGELSLGFERYDPISKIKELKSKINTLLSK